MEKLTISDIATLAKVSTATVSNYLNGNFNKMSVKTRRHLEEIISQTNYRPNSTARDLAKNESKTIGVSIADITNPFTSTVLSGISDVCNRYGYKVVFTNADQDSQTEVDNIIRLRYENVAGFIFDPVSPNGPIYKSFSNKSSVMVDLQAKSLNMDTIVTDNEKSVFEMTQKMLDKGYDELYFVSWPLKDVSTRLQRYQGFLKAAKYEDDGSHLLIVPHHGSQEEYDAFNEQVADIIKNKGSKKVGFFAMNGRVFLRLLQAAQIQNYSYPQDYGVATYEELAWMKVLKPGISCIRQDSREIGEKAAELLNKKLTGKASSQPEVTIIPTKLIIRESF